jgi:hypothetical protein
MAKLYYTPPSEECFEELQRESIRVWQEYDDTYGYASGKVNRIKDLENVGDNFMYIFAMFDILNQSKVAQYLSIETKKALKERMIDGGHPVEFIPF